MNFIKRAILSMKKRKGTSLILMAVFLIVTNLVLAGFTIQNASKKLLMLQEKNWVQMLLWVLILIN